MSWLSVPRIHFRGQFETSPPTANNNDVVTILDPTLAIIDRQGLSDREIRQWLMQTKTLPSGGISINSGWNYFGDNRVGFAPWTQTVSGNLASGTFLSLKNNDKDPVLGATVALLGSAVDDLMEFATIVDLDPTEMHSSHIHAGQFQLIGKSGEILLKGLQPIVAYSYWLTPWRNLCGKRYVSVATWQFVIAKENLTFDTTVNSLLLNDLMTSTEQAGGIVVRFCTYDVVHVKLKDSEVAQKFAIGEHAQNTAYGKMVGTIGIWQNNEPQSFPAAERLMLPSYPITLEIDCSSSSKLSTKQSEPLSSSIGQSTEKTKVFLLGPVLVAFDRSRHVATVDLVNTFPEINPQGDKVNIGSVSLMLKLEDGQLIKIGAVPYDKEHYEETTGIVDLLLPTNLEAAQITSGQFLLVRDSAPTRSLVEEIDYLIVHTDNRCIYVEEDEEIALSLQIFLKGFPVAHDTKVKLTQYQYITIAPGTDIPLRPHQDRAAIPPLSSTGTFPSKQFVRLFGENSLIEIPDSIMSKAGERTTFTIKARRPGIAMIQFLPPNKDVLSDHFVDWVYGFYMGIRVFPKDNYNYIPDEELTWDFIYRHVFRYFFLLYPALERYFPLDNQEEIKKRIPLLRSLITKASPDGAWSTPLAWDLSAGKRKLLDRWCSLVAGKE